MNKFAVVDGTQIKKFTSKATLLTNLNATIRPVTVIQRVTNGTGFGILYEGQSDWCAMKIRVDGINWITP